MGYGREKFSARTVEKLSKVVGLHSDGGGLCLRVTSETSRSWVFRYMLNKRSREAGLGRYPDVTLAEARKRAQAMREIKSSGADPLDAREAEKKAAVREAALSLTFKQVAAEYIASKRAAWTKGHAAAWLTMIHETRRRGAVFPPETAAINALPVASIGTDEVMDVLKPIWPTKPETASRVRGRIETILNAAVSAGYRAAGDNPARWRGHLEFLFPARSSIQPINHQPALPWKDIPAFMAKLRTHDRAAARALEFTILTAARTNEVVGASWPEINFLEAIWTVPPERMKGRVSKRREHRVPLSDRAVKILRDVGPRQTGYIFERKPGRSLSNTAMIDLLHNLWPGAITVHGFRSTFRDWATDETDFQDHVIEMALAHSIKSGTVAAYRRTILMEKRRALMDAWATFCSG